MEKANSLLASENLSKDFPGVRALSEVSLSIDKGEIHALVGENGAGKSTLIKILAGVESPNPGGKIFMEGEEIIFSDALVSVAAGISVIFQDFSLFPNLSVAENICFSYVVAKNKQMVQWKEISAIAKKALDEIRLDIDPSLIVEKLSIAKQQMVAIARALALNAKLVIMDEPTSTLSSSEVDHLFEIIRDLKSKGITTLFISHKLDEVLTIADRVSVLRDGQMIGTFDKNDLDQQKLISYMVGRELNLVQKDCFYTDETVLEVFNLTKKKNFKDISLKVRKGEVVCITGLVGSGRSELLTALFGINRIDSGEIFLNGKKVNIKTPAKTKKWGVAFVPENRQLEGLVLQQDVKSNVTVTILDRIKSKIGLISDSLERKEAETLIKKLDVRPSNPDIMIQNLSGGNQQKVVLAKWLAMDPNLLLIDEPTNGIDIGAKSEIYKLIRLLAKQGMAVLMVSSEMTEVFTVADTVLVMRSGRLVASMDITKASQESIMQHALLGTPIDQGKGGAKKYEKA